MRRLWTPLALIAALGLVGNGRVWAQKPPPPVAPNPQAPTLALPLPLGIQRGTSLDLTLTGSNLAGPTGVWTSFPAKINIPTEEKNGTDNSKLKVRLEVPSDAPLGFGALRLATTRGMSNLRLFCIDDLPQILKQETSKNKATPQSVQVPCVVVGRIEPEQADYFKTSVQTGQRVSFDVLGRRLGGPIDPQISIYSTKTGRELAHENDSPGCQTDPRLTYVFKDAGEYLIEVKDVLYRGGPEYAYRLRIGDFPCATVPIPMGAKRGSKVKVEFAGPQVDGVAPVEVTVSNDPAINTVWVAPKGQNGLHGWPVALAVTDLEERVEQEPNDEPAKANAVTVPGAITGRFQQSSDIDCYRFPAKKGQKILIEADTLELYSPTLVYMVVKNGKTGAELAKSNPAANPPLDQRIEFAAPEDGDYIVEVQHLNFLGGPSEAYRLVLTPIVPDFDVTVGIDRYDIAPGSVAGITLQAIRRGYTGPIHVALAGAPPGITGSATLKAGEGVLLLHAAADVPQKPFRLGIVAKANMDGKVVERRASGRAPISQSLGNLPFPPRDLLSDIGLAVKEKAPFALTATFEPAEGFPGGSLTLVVSAKRDAGFDDAIALNPPAGLPANVPPPKLPAIAKGQSEVKVKIDNAKTPFGEFLVLVSGTGKHQGKDFAANALPAKLVVTKPFNIEVEPAKLALKPGEKAHLTITATRRAGYNGPIALEVRKLPANVTAAKATIAMGQTTADVEITAAANAPPAEVKDVDVVGTATAAGNLQNNSPTFVFRIDKK